MTEEKTVKECFQYNVDTRQMMVDMRQTIKEQEDRLVKSIDEIKDKLVHRLPVWVTFYISFLTLLVGGLLAKTAF